MLVGVFKNNNPSAFVFLPIIALILWTNGFITHQDVDIRHQMPLYETFIQPLLAYPLIATILALLLVIAEAFFLKFIIDKNEILAKPSFLPALLYIIFMSVDNTMLTLNPTVLGNLFILLTLYVLAESYRKDVAFSNAFDSGVLYALATLFYAPAIILLPLLIIGLFVFRPFYWREWLICFIGVLIPYFFVATSYFWHDNLDYFMNDKIYYTITKPSLKYTSALYTTAGIICLILFLSFPNVFKNITGAFQKKSKSTLLLVWLAVFALFSLQITPSYGVKFFALFFIPISVFCADYLINVKKNWWSELLFILLIVSVIINLISVHF